MSIIKAICIWIGGGGGLEIAVVEDETPANAIVSNLSSDTIVSNSASDTITGNV